MRPVGSKYLLEEPLGRGATGTVWRARQRETAGAEAAVPGQPGEAVAIKVLKEELAGDPDVVMRFLRERSVLLRLAHHNIVRTRDLVVEGDVLALVMDLVEGPDLHRYLRENGPFSSVGAALLTAQVADALAASHADGVVHRDLKPANVLLADGPDGMRPMLTDFGIARLADSPGLTRTQEFVGTPAYVAPESAEGREQTSAVDVYGAGILLYELVSGRPPFAGENTLQVLHRHLGEEPQRPPGLPEPLWTVIERCLRKRPEERPSAENLARALRTVAAGIGAGATPEQASAALGVAALLGPDLAPTTAPSGQLSGDATQTQVLPHGSAAPGGPGDQQAQGAPGGYDPEGATSVLPQTGGPGGPQGDGNADPTRVMPPVPGGAPQQGPEGGQPPQADGPHPWQSQLRAARDRNEQTQVQPLDPSQDPLRRRPQRRPAPQQAQPRPDQYAPAPPDPGRRPQRRATEPPPQRYEPRQRPPEPRPRREPRQRSANPMRIPGLGCLKGCLFSLLILALIAVLVWNFTPLPQWWESGQEAWDATKDFFTDVWDFLAELGGDGGSGTDTGETGGGTGTAG
ncbi:serine/threonine-protein kinase [Streptomyces sp. JJ36]|uniref:serine/threonine-protein kinase n=1 Tax=Streptomyces sp. JJ36 TaxID=2736645 RepID=UPI001F02872A|nr:serine/threonine-protein kinase [Streptomyces sp. JJ36]MCF6526545.1 protein kinase [Streptomyces sp. JJ36]